MIKPIFENVPTFGDLYLVTVLEGRFDPYLFVCRDMKENFYLCIKRAYPDNSEYFIAETRSELAKGLVDGKLTIYHAFRAHDGMAVHVNARGEYSKSPFPSVMIEEYDLPTRTIKENT